MFKISLFSIILGFLPFFAIQSAAEEPPEELDFVGGYFDDGVYRCYQEPCFNLHKHAYPAANNIPFESDMWPYWLDLDNNCQKDNVQVLVKESQSEVRFENNNRCDAIVSGSWADLYTGELLTDASAVDTDHLVSMKEAHAYGGLAWPREKRAAFANIAANQIVVSAEHRIARGGAPASQWMPPNESYWCEYVVMRERIARMFHLRFPTSEIEFNRKIKNLYCKY